MAPSKSRPSLVGRAVAFTQDACLQHRNIASGGSKRTLERPERLQAVNVGLAAIYVCLEAAASARQATTKSKTRRSTKSNLKVDLATPFTVIRSTSIMQEIPLHPAARDLLHIKTEEDEDSRALTYAETLQLWCKESRQKIVRRQREIPEDLEADLYLCPKSFDAIKAAMGTVCEAIDTVAESSRSPSSGHGTRAFVAIRPPGHHCVSNAPAGLGFVNNVMVGAVHAFYQHSYTHIVIFDTDLHHGNGTQQIVQEINRQRMKTTANADNHPIMFFGSMHDIKSYPCLNRPESTAAALLCSTGEDGQWIENATMIPCATDEDFWKAYSGRYQRLIVQAEKFIQATKPSPDKVLVLMSCGFAASMHEDPTMSTHGRHVPTSFYARFARDAAAFADRVAEGRLVSVLEGGYSDRALISGVMAHMAGLAGDSSEDQDEWWNVDRLAEAEKLLKKQPTRKAKSEVLPAWLVRAKQVVNCLNEPLDMNGKSLVLDVPAPEVTLKEPGNPLSLSAESPKAGSSKRAAVVLPPSKKTKRAKHGASSSQPSMEVTPTQSTEIVPSTSSGSSMGAISTPSSSTIAPASQRSMLPASVVAAESSVPPASSAIQDAYTEVSTCLAALLSLVDPGSSTSTSVPAPVLSTVTRSIRPLRGCIGRLERVLSDRTARLEVLFVLEKLLEEAHRACEPLKGQLESVDRAMYDLEGAALDLKSLCANT